MTLPSAALSNLLYTAEFSMERVVTDCGVVCRPFSFHIFPSALKDVFALFQQLSFLASILFTNLSHFFLCPAPVDRNTEASVCDPSCSTRKERAFVCACVSVYASLFMPCFMTEGYLEPLTKVHFKNRMPPTQLAYSPVKAQSVHSCTEPHKKQNVRIVQKH